MQEIVDLILEVSFAWMKHSICILKMTDDTVLWLVILGGFWLGADVHASLLYGWAV